MAIELKPLCTLIVKVAKGLDVGTVPTGTASVTEITGVEVSGERLRGTLAGHAAADWMTRCGDLGIIDVRMTIRTHDDALVTIRYGGRLDLADPAAGITAYVAPTFEAGDARYGWLNRIQGAGKGRFAMGADGPQLEYEFFEIG